MTKTIPLSPWQRPGYLEAGDGHLLMDGVDLVDLAENSGTPHYVYSEKKLRDNARRLITELRRVHANTHIAYASKALANNSILAILKDEGLGVEVNSGGELHKALTAGFTADQIVFNGVAKSKTEINAAISAQIKAINVDSLSELDRVIECSGSSTYPANITLRVVPEIQGGGTAGLETGSTSSKFGMTRDEIRVALHRLRAPEGNINFNGFHAHIGSQVNDLDAYRAEAKFMIDFMLEIKDELPGPLKHINLGGGFPTSYIQPSEQHEPDDHFRKTYSATIDSSDIATALIEPLREHFGPDIELIVEPGRSIVADSAVLLTRVEAIKERDGLKWLYLDAGYGAMLDAVFGWYFHMITANRASNKDTARFRVFGPLCDSYDAFFDVSGEAAIGALLATEPALAQHSTLLEEILLHQPRQKNLPATTTVGDVVAVLDVGAYNIETQSQYCGRLQPTASLIRMDGTVQVIRRGETFDDLMAKDK